MTIATNNRSTIAGNWIVDPTHSTLSFGVRHMVVSTYRGQMHNFDASLVSDGDRVSLTGSGAVRDIDVRDSTLASHVLAPDFFDAERHPEIRVTSDVIEIDGKSIVVAAQLTIKGITRSVELRGAIAGPVEDPFGATRLGLQLEATIDRRDYGLDWNIALSGGGWALGNEVTISAQLEFVRTD
jgi:polyisoprenoid-binding protein YceI